jgi:hypothetical protein
MKAIVYTQYGSPDVLQLKEVSEPEPKENQVLVRVHAASINALGYRRFEKTPLMGRFMEERVLKTINKILGADIARRVEAVGSKVKQLQPGIAKYFGAEVTAVCSPRNLETACSIGADHVIDYTKEDFAKNGQRYDLILAVRLSEGIKSQGSLCRGWRLHRSDYSSDVSGFVGIADRKQEDGFHGNCESHSKGFVFYGRASRFWQGRAGHRKMLPVSEVPAAIRYLAEEGRAYALQFLELLKKELEIKSRD